MIFQDPLASLNPCFTVGYQLMETMRIHGTTPTHGVPSFAASARLDLLEQVEIPDPRTTPRARSRTSFPAAWRNAS